MKSTHTLLLTALFIALLSVRVDAAEETGKRLEENPEALEKIRGILQKGIPEQMTVQVTNKSKDTAASAPTVERNEAVKVIKTAAPAKAEAKPESKPEAKVEPKADNKAADKPADKAKSDDKAKSKTEEKSKPTESAAKAEAPAKVETPAKTEPAPKPPARKAVAKPAQPLHVVERPTGEMPWEHTGPAGPANWGNLSMAYQACGNGKNQSPIHIDPQEVISLALEPLSLEYGELMGNLVNTGHAIQLDVSGYNNLKSRGRSYSLQSVQFKHPAEEVINGQGYPMSMQWLHKDFAGNLLMLSVLVEVGAENPAVNLLWSRLPFLRNERNPIQSNRISLKNLLPAQLGYYTYTGSLTQPPCTEGVLWVVLKQPITLSAQQVATLAKLYPMNARPVQPGNGRLIQASQP